MVRYTVAIYPGDRQPVGRRREDYLVLAEPNVSGLHLWVWHHSDFICGVMDTSRNRTSATAIHGWHRINPNVWYFARWGVPLRLARVASLEVVRMDVAAAFGGACGAPLRNGCIGAWPVVPGRAWTCSAGCSVRRMRPLIGQRGCPNGPRGCTRMERRRSATSCCAWEASASDAVFGAPSLFQ